MNKSISLGGFLLALGMWITPTSAIAQIGGCCSQCVTIEECMMVGGVNFNKCQIQWLGELKICQDIGSAYCRVCIGTRAAALPSGAASTTDVCDDSTANWNVAPFATYDEDSVTAVAATNPALAFLASILMVNIATGQPIPTSTFIYEEILDGYDLKIFNAPLIDRAYRSGTLNAPINAPKTGKRGIKFSFFATEMGAGRVAIDIVPESPAVAERFGAIREVVFQRVPRGDGIRVNVVSMR